MNTIAPPPPQQHSRFNFLFKTKKSFDQFYNATLNDKYSDFTVVLKGNDNSAVKSREIKAHRIILANHSDFFQAAFDNTLFRESSSSRLELHFDDPRNAIPLLFEYMYTGELKAELHMLIPLIHASEQLLCMELITQLKGTLRQFLSALERPSTSPASPSHLLQCNHITAALISSLPDVPVAVPHSSSSSLSLTFSDIYDHDDIEDSTISTTSRILGGTGGGGGIRGGNRGMRRGSGSLFGLPELADGTDDMNAINNNSYSNTNHLFQISTVLGMLKDALFFGMSDVAKSIVDLIASRLDELPMNLDLSYLPFNLFSGLIGHPSLSIDSEFRLYTLVARYVKNQSRYNSLILHNPHHQQQSNVFGRSNTSTSPATTSTGHSLYESTTARASKLLSKSASDWKRNVSFSLPIQSSESRLDSMDSMMSDEALQVLSGTGSNTSFTTLPLSITDSQLQPSSLLTQDQIDDLFSKIKFEELDTQEMEMVIAQDLVPKSIIIKGLMTSLKISRGQLVKHKDESRQYQKFSPRMTKEFVYSGNDFDENGLIYTLGSRTNGSSRSKTSSSKQQSQHISQYQNPHVLGILNVTMSSVLFGCPANITSRNQIATCTKRDNNSWISIDFGPSVEIQVKAYTLMHGASKDNVNLKSWVLEGCNSPPKSEGEAVAGEGGAIGNATTAPHPSSSNNSGSVADTTGDDGQWIVISSHFNDPSLSGAPYKTATWVLGDKSSQSIDKHTKSGPGKEAFWRRLRVRTLGNYFVQVSGFEVYGVVKSDFSL